MVEWWQALSVAQQVFSGMAIGFGAILSVLLALSLVGGELDADLDVETESLTLKGLLTFLAFFGFGGFATVSSGGPLWLALVVGFGAGYVAVSLLTLVLAWVYGLGEEGNRPVHQALYAEGRVYLAIPAAGQGSGRISLPLGTRVVELEAVSQEAEGIPTGSAARVVEILGPGKVRVESVRLLE